MKRFAGLLIAVVVIAALAAPKLASKNSSDNPRPARETAPPTLRVEVLEVVPERLTESLSTTGTVRANEQVELVSEIQGKIAKISFREGSRVKAGQLLLEIDDAELRAEHERALFRQELAERRELQRKKLRDEGVISGEEYDLALNQLNVLRSELRLIEAQLEKTKIRAPFSGVIGLRYVSEGSYLTPQRRIATLQDVDSVKIDFSAPEKYASRLRTGGEITFRVKGDERAFSASIYAIEPTVDAETRSLQLRARSANPDLALVPGAFADVELVVQEVAAAITVPSIAVIPELGGKKVYVLEDGKAQSRVVETGIRKNERVQVTKGLAPGDQVIVSAIQQLRPGLEVAAFSQS